MRAWGRRLLIFAAGAVGCWLLRPWAIQGGDWLLYVDEVLFAHRRPIFSLREPGSTWLWQGMAWTVHVVDEGFFRDDPLSERSITYRNLFKQPKFKKRDFPRRGPVRFLTQGQIAVGFDLLGALSGGAYLALLAAFLRDLGPASMARRSLAAVVVLTSAVTWNFVGHIEYYAPLHPALLFFYWRALVYLRGPTPRAFAWLIAAAWITVFIHRVAVFHLPALAVIFLAPAGRWGPRRPTRGESLVMLTALITTCALHAAAVLMASAIGRGPFLVIADYNWLPELITPFSEEWRQYVIDHSRIGSIPIYTFGSASHWNHFFFFIAVSSPLGLPIVVARARRLRRPEEIFLAAAAASAWLWAFFWHPHLGLLDWDLFSNPGIPTNLLAAALLVRDRPQ